MVGLRYLIAACVAVGCGGGERPCSKRGDCGTQDTQTVSDECGDEICDEIDNDCDGEIDEGVEATFFWDGDGDGYGDEKVPTSACDAPAGFADVAGDCDDYDPGRHPDPALLTFEDVTLAAGLDALQWDRAAEPPRCGHDSMSGGVAVGDFDGDGRHDVFLPRLYASNLLYRNVGDGTFVEEGAVRGLDFSGSTNGALWVDVDGDGDLDLYLSMLELEAHRLFINYDGDFVDEAGIRGVDLPVIGDICSLSFSVSAADVDGDGDLDLHTTSWRPQAGSDNDRARLLLNDGAGFFEDGTEDWGLDLRGRPSFTSGFGDFDGDGRPDMAMIADFEQSGLFLNTGVDFLEVTVAAQVGLDENGMGGDIADFDNDGDLDWFVTSVYDETPGCSENWSCSGNRLYVNDGSAFFEDQAAEAGVLDGQWGWGGAFADYDNDGWLDLVQANGFEVPLFEDGVLRVWRQDPPGSFVELGCEVGAVAVGASRAVVPFDYDDDGDLDLLVTRSGDSPRLLRNDTTGTNWLRVSLQDQGANPLGIGATIEVIRNQLPVLRRDLNANSTYLSGPPPEVHFGLGAAETVELRVRWPDGETQVIAGVSANQIMRLSR